MTNTTNRITICAECHGTVPEGDSYHSYLFCELVKLGHDDPAAYLASYGFVRAPLPVEGEEE